MIEHIVLFKWIENTSQETIDQALNALKALKDKIPGIVDLSCGKNFSERNQGFQDALIVRFGDRPSLEAYFPHPDHQKVVKTHIRPILADILSIDYEHH
jgi:hypothetical protein